MALFTAHEPLVGILERWREPTLDLVEFFLANLFGVENAERIQRFFAKRCWRHREKGDTKKGTESKNGADLKDIACGCWFCDDFINHPHLPGS